MAQRAHSRASGSGRSRHRKPNHHVRNLGIATAPLVAAIPMATASPASADKAGPWDRLASCESGGNWGINTGNGYYGGLQFADGTWDGYGGERYASRADLADRNEQVIIGARLLENSGWGPWPACSSRLGLDGEDRRQALATAEEYRQAQRNGDAKGDGQQGGEQKAAEQRKADEQKAAEEKAAEQRKADERAADQARKADEDREADERRADERRAEDRTADEVAAADRRTDEGRVSTERASRGKHRKLAASDVYVVRRGDSLSAIARAKDLPGGWQNLYKINRETIGGNPGLIFPGQRLTLG